MKKDKINKISYSTVFVGIKKILGNNQTAFSIRGSGFIIKNGDKKYIVTCDHVYRNIPDSERNNIFCGVVSYDTKDSKGIKRYNFYDIKYYTSHSEQRRDVCLFEWKYPQEFKDYGFNENDLSQEEEILDLDILDKITFYGYPLANEFLQMKIGITLAASEAIISAKKFSSKDDKIDFIIVDKLINPGSSGSPVFCDKKIIGLASGNIDKAHKIGETLINIPVNIGIIRPSNYILELL